MVASSALTSGLQTRVLGSAYEVVVLSASFRRHAEAAGVTSGHVHLVLSTKASRTGWLKS